MNNCVNIHWVTLSTPSDAVHDVFLNFTVAYGYSQLVTESMRDNKIFDVLLSNERVGIYDVSVLPPFSSGDHICLQCFDAVGWAA